MIHFFPTFSRQAAESPFADALRRTGVEHRIFAGQVRFIYRTRAKLFLVCIPRLAIFALRSALASLVFSRPVPHAVVLSSDVEVLVFSLVRLLFHRQVKVVLNTFILTTRRSPWANRLRLLYFRFVLGRTDLVVVHSKLEEERYSRVFAGVRTQFVYVPWGTHINKRDALLSVGAANGKQSNIVVTAGKSGRDYATLFEAIKGVDAELRVICDFAGVLPDTADGHRITILSKCYGENYLRELVRAAVVVVPLAVDDISAGQMVMIQAMGLGKAVIVSDTPTIRDYVGDRYDAWLVPCGEVPAMRDAIRALLSDPALRERLGHNAKTTFEENFGMESHVRHLVGKIVQLDRRDCGIRRAQ